MSYTGISKVEQIQSDKKYTNCHLCDMPIRITGIVYIPDSFIRCGNESCYNSCEKTCLSWPPSNEDLERLKKRRNKIPITLLVYKQKVAQTLYTDFLIWN